LRTSTTLLLVSLCGWVSALPTSTPLPLAVISPVSGLWSGSKPDSGWPVALSGPGCTVQPPPLV